MTEQPARWLVVKFMPDLRRREPTNVGVMVETPMGRRARFRGQRPDGTIDGRQIKFTDVENWKRWVEYWTWMLQSRDAPLEGMVTEGPSSNFMVVDGGRQLYGAVEDPDRLINDLYTTLVEAPREAAPPTLRLRADALLMRTSMWLDHHFFLDHPVISREHETLKFPYVWQNGHTAVGALLPALDVGNAHKLLWEVTTLPADTRTVVLTDEEITDDVGDVGRLIQQKVGHVLNIEAVSPDDVTAAFEAA